MPTGASPTTESGPSGGQPRSRKAGRSVLRAWLRRHDRALSKQAVADIDGTDALSEAVKGGDRADVSMTQLRALNNTAKMCTLPDLQCYIRKRRERRQDTSQAAAAFWDELDRALGSLMDEYASEAVQACGAAETTPQTVQEDVFDERAVKTLLARRYLSHFVAHCQYLQRR